MKYGIVVIGLIILVASPAFTEELLTLSLDDRTTAYPVIEVDKEVKTEGAGALKITTRWPTTVNLGETADLEIEDGKLIYIADVKTEFRGEVFLEMWAHLDGGRYFSRGMNDSVKDRSGWRTIRVPFFFQEGQKPDKITLNLVINGIGVVWIDHIRLQKTSL